MQIAETVTRFPQLNILVLGDVFLDEYLSGDCTRISPEAPVPILSVTSTRRVLGGAANTAANIASLGGKTHLIGLIGEDSHGEEFQELALRQGIRLTGIKDGRPTIKKTRLLGQRQQLLRLDYEETHPIDPATEKKILQAFQEQLPQAQVVVISDYAKGFLTRSLCQALIQGCIKAGKMVIVDPRPQNFDFYQGSTYLTPNWKEGQELLGRAPGPMTDAEVDSVGSDLSGRLEARILLTLGAAGMAFFHNRGKVVEKFRIPTAAREVFDVSGAGDTVVAAFALAKGAGLSDRDAMTLANRAAGIVVAKLGTATVTPDELSDDGAGRLLSRAALAPLSARLRSQGKTLVSLNGSFDLLHAGHLYILEEAKKQGDVLVVGLNSDASVKRYKGNSRPIIPQEYRAQMLLALRAVDYVHLFDEEVPMPFLEQLKPHVHVNGSEYGENCIEADTVRKNGGRIHIVEKIPGLSTSEVVSRILSSGDK